MNRQKALLHIALVVCIAFMAVPQAQAESIGDFSPVVGQWKADTPGGGIVVDGSKHAVSADEHFPIAVHVPTKDFQEGTLAVQFKPIAGRSDQAGGIFFDRKDNGDYFVVRANALENNLNLYRYASGRRTPIKEVEGAPAQAGVWHELKVVVSGSRVAGYLDGKLLLQHDLGRKIAGGVGLWSKDDSVTLFKDFQVMGKQ